MKQFNFNVKPRAATGKGAARNTRREGFVPAIIYGAGEANELVVIEERELRSALRAGAAKALVTLKGAGAETLAIVKETQYDALGDRLEHVDFLRVVKNQPIHVAVPLVISGKAKGEAFGGILEHLTREVRMECLPMEIPDQLTIDITPLDVGGAVHLSDLTSPAGARFLDPLDTPLVVMKASRMARATTKEEDEAAAAAAAAEAAEAEAAESAEAKPAAGKAGAGKTTGGKAPAGKSGEGKAAPPKKEK